MIDTKRKIRFYDDRGKYKRCLYLSQILFENSFVCLCITDNSIDEILFNKITGRVLTSNLQFYSAENYDEMRIENDDAKKQR
jgi:hypothetical protein